MRFCTYTLCLKNGAHTLCLIILANVNQLKKFFHCRILGGTAEKVGIRVDLPPHLKRVDALPR